MLVEPGAQEARTGFSALKSRFFVQPATVGREQKAAIAARSPKAADRGSRR
jgi:hypothetical protein